MPGGAPHPGQHAHPRPFRRETWAALDAVDLAREFGTPVPTLQDVPPFMILEGHPSRVRGVNKIGLQRSDVSNEEIEALSTAFRRIFRADQPRHQVLAEMRAEGTSSELVNELLEALAKTELGAKGRYRESLREEFKKEGEKLIFAAPRREGTGRPNGSRDEQGAKRSVTP